MRNSRVKNRSHVAATTSGGRAAPRPRTHRPGAGTVLAVVTALTAVGCDGSDRVDDGAPSSGERESKSRSAQPSGSPSVDRTRRRNPWCRRRTGMTSAPVRTVTVRSRCPVRFKGPAGPAMLTVTEVGPHKVEYTVKSGNGQSKGGADGSGQGCVTVLRSNGGGNSCGGLGKACRVLSPTPWCFRWRPERTARRSFTSCRADRARWLRGWRSCRGHCGTPFRRPYPSARRTALRRSLTSSLR